MGEKLGHTEAGVRLIWGSPNVGFTVNLSLENVMYNFVTRSGYTG